MEDCEASEDTGFDLATKDASQCDVIESYDEVDAGLLQKRKDLMDGITPHSPTSPQSDVSFTPSEPQTALTFQPILPDIPQSTDLPIAQGQTRSSSAVSSVASLPILPPIANTPDKEKQQHADHVELQPKEALSTAQNQTKKVVDRFKLSEKPVAEVLSEVHRRLTILLECSAEDYATKIVNGDLVYLKEASKYGERGPDRLILCDAFAESKATEVFQRIWEHNFNDTSSNFLSRENPNLFNNMKDSMILLWNGTDMSTTLVKEIVDTNLHVEILNYLKDEKLSSHKLKGVYKKYLIKGLMGIINNLVQTCDCVHTLRELGAVELFMDLHKAKDDMIACKALMVLAYLINEEENKTLNADDANFAFMVKILQSCLEEENLHSKRYGFSAHEIVEALNRLAANDHNKHGIVRNNALSLYVRLMQPDMESREQIAASRGIWTLAFRCADDIKQEPGCMQALENLAENGCGDDVKKQAMGALWIMSGWKSTADATPAAPAPPPAPSVGSAAPAPPPGGIAPTSPKDEDTPHVFISYNWGSKATVLKIKDFLKSQGYKVWMDVENMSGSILEAMALAVEKAAVVIICYSQKYKESPNCRTEAEYTFKLGKAIVPLRMQKRYSPDGWLGALLGNRLFFDFSVDDHFPSSFQGLLKELGDKGLATSQSSHNDHNGATETTQTQIIPTKVIEHDSHPRHPSVASVKATTVGLWEEQDVEEWLRKSGFASFVDKFEGFDGHALLEYRFMLAQAPEFFYTSLKEEIGLSLIQMLKFCKRLKEMDLN